MGREGKSESTVWTDGVSTSIREEVSATSECSISGGAGARFCGELLDKAGTVCDRA